jgi:hypothetical protein
MPDFIPGSQLSESYYREAVRPILDDHCPGLTHSAALIGFGSDVLGFDTPVSRDHMWGPRLLLFLSEEDFIGRREAVLETLRQKLPVSFHGYSTHFGSPDGIGVRLLTAIEHGPIDPLIQFHTLPGFWQQQLDFSPFAEPAPADWLTFQEHRLLSLTAGKVFHDDLGLEAARARIAYYPHDVWLYLLAAQWQLISQEEAFPGRAAGLGDTLGARIITARQVERLMRLCFLLEKRYPPYSKWFGTAFRRLDCYPAMGPLLENALAAPDYPTSERWLARAYSLAADLFNRLGIAEPIDPRTRTFSGWHRLQGGGPEELPGETRPYQVLFAGRFAEAAHAAIQDPRLLALLANIGSVNQFLVESSDALQNVKFCRSLKDDLNI